MQIQSSLPPSLRSMLLAAVLAALVACPPTDPDEDAGADAASDAAIGVDREGTPDSGRDTGSPPDSATGDDAAVIEDAASPDLDLDNFGALEGHVTDALGRSVGDALVTVGETVARTDFEGYYLLPYLPAGDISVVFEAEWFHDSTADTTAVVGEIGTLDVQLDALPMQVHPDDLALMESYSETFDWATDKISFCYVARPTLGEFDKALWRRNPALWDPTTPQQPTVTPSPAIDISGGAVTGLDLPMMAGSTYEGEQAIELGTVVDTLAETPLTADEIAASVLWLPAIDGYIFDWDPMAALELYYLSLTVQGQRWGGASTLSPQTLQLTYLHDGELWVELVFEPFIELGGGITDSDGDGYREIYGRVPADYFDAALYDELLNSYVTPTYDTLGMRGVMYLVKTHLYRPADPQELRTLGMPYEAEGIGAVQYPFMVWQTSNDSINIILVEPE